MTKKREFPPLLSASQRAIKVGDLLYTGAVVKDYGADDRYGAKVEAFRVVDVNLQYRTVRLRCAKGCETFLRYNDGCSRHKYWSTVEDAQAEVRRAIERYKRSISEDVAKYTKRLKQVSGIKASAARPAAIPVEVQA